MASPLYVVEREFDAGDIGQWFSPTDLSAVAAAKAGMESYFDSLEAHLA